MVTKMIKNINSLRYSINNSFSNMIEVLSKYNKASIYDASDNEYEIFYAVGTCLHWIMDCLDRIGGNFKFEDNEQKLVSSFRGANNLLKHNVNIIHLHKVDGGITFPITFPLVIPAKHRVWLKVNENQIEASYLNQIRNYNETLGDKDIQLTMELAIGIINKYFDVIEG